LFICYPVVVEQSQEKKCSLAKEICFLFLHGLLHLLGYDHEKTADRKKMFLLQDKVLDQLKI
jgi:probable rRNA maturation factor